ncbi:TetR/AcrR family transcriptional regulator [Dyadobacter sandarakinus]|uniref:TetR/AcrR family transcriptional regulator n=1 Tax=Dyadobacter sandarakinus TaxID=2747268 RepID=A0ABX7I339_9BACT|nr:TetR/AcrR family transcriptional regulator [Dyadobacter sandarakinus]QRR00474.1 TetR/AcrR family transcriptional regulator [Dyadobacter sandarakinus]
MAIKERKEREKQDMRNLIIESATRLFLKQGYDKTSIRNIAEDIEYSPATIYLYFKDKDEIFYVIHENGFSMLLAEFRKSQNIVNPFERLVAICKSYIRFAIENQDFYDLMFIMRAPLAEIECNNEWPEGQNAFAFLVQVIHECLDQQLIRPVDVGLQALSVWSMGHGLVSLYVRGRCTAMKFPEADMEQLLDDAVVNYLEAIRT